MKYIKEYEAKNNMKIGDYVLCHTNSKYIHNSDETVDFIHSNVGRYVKYARGYDSKYGIKYENIPNIIEKNLDEGLLWFDRYEIFDYCKTAEELELKLNAKKYNL